MLTARSATPAFIDRPLEITVAPSSIVAVLVISAKLTATPMPTPVPSSLVVAAPSAVATASVLLVALTDTVPPDVIVTASGTIASVRTTATVTPTAPATWTGPSEVSDFLPSVLPVVPLSFRRRCPHALSAVRVWLWTWLLTPPPWSLPSFASFAFAALSGRRPPRSPWRAPRWVTSCARRKRRRRRR